MEEILFKIRSNSYLRWITIIAITMVFSLISLHLKKEMSPLDLSNPKDMEPARMEKATEAGDIQAQLLLGQMYQFGLSVKEDKEKAIYFYSKAASFGSPEGAYNTAILLSAKGSKEAIKYLWMAYKADIPSAAPLLGEYLIKNNSIEEGKSILFQSAQNGDPLAMRFLAYGYSEGVFENSSINEAIFWGDISRFFEKDAVKKMEINNKLKFWMKKLSTKEIEIIQNRSDSWKIGYSLR